MPKPRSQISRASTRSVLLDLDRAPGLPPGAGQAGAGGDSSYDPRHSFGTAMCKVTGETRIVKELLGHSTTKITDRYTLGHVPDFMQIAAERFADLTAAPLTPPPASRPQHLRRVKYASFAYGVAGTSTSSSSVSSAARSQIRAIRPIRIDTSVSWGAMASASFRARLASARSRGQSRPARLARAGRQNPEIATAPRRGRSRPGPTSSRGGPRSPPVRDPRSERPMIVDCEVGYEAPRRSYPSRSCRRAVLTTTASVKSNRGRTRPGRPIEIDRSGCGSGRSGVR